MCRSSAKWALYLSEQDFGKFTNYAKEFALIQTRWILGSTPEKEHLREYGKPIPVLLDRGAAGWTYEGTYIPKVLFSIGEVLWKDTHMNSVCCHSPHYSISAHHTLLGQDWYAT